MKTEVHTEDMIKCPKHIPVKEWVYACERAERARRYARMFPSTLKNKPDVLVEQFSKFQDPLWQWENEVRGRFGGVVGGSLSGTRDQRS